MARAFVIACLSATGARAETPAPAELRLELAGCPDSVAPGLAAGVKLEIDVLVRERDASAASPGTVVIACDASAAHITVETAGVRRESTVDLGTLAPEHRARALALAAAELVHATSAAPAATPAATAIAQPGVPPADLRATAPAPSPSPDRETARPELLVGGLAQWLGKPSALLFGARVSLRYPLGRIFVPALSADGSLGSVRVSSAEVGVQTAGAAAHLYLRATAGRFHFAAGPGARFAWVQVTGRPTAGTTLQGLSFGALWGGPELRARVDYGATRRRFPLLALELGTGYVTRPMRGLQDGAASVYAVEGTWVSVSAEIGLGL